MPFTHAIKQSTLSPNTWIWGILLLSLHTIMITSAGTVAQCPSVCACADIHQLEVNCSSRGLLTPPLTSFATLTLDLSHNRLGPILNGSLVQMGNLTTLDLSHNGLNRLLACTFTGLLGMKELRLSHNKLTSLPESLFTDCENLEVLDLSHNTLTSIPSDVTRFTPKLKYLDLSHNRFTSAILGPRFQNTRILQYIDLSFNNLASIPADTFHQALQWEGTITRTVKIAYCNLTSIADGAFTKVPNLMALDLSGNTGLTLTKLTHVVKELETKGLKELSVARTNISTLVPLFNDVTRLSLKFLNASHNNIRSVPSNTFANIRSLRLLDLSHNFLTNLDVGFKDLVNLHVLNVSGNEMQTFTGEAASQLSQLTDLDMSHNKIEAASLTSMRKLTSLRANHNLMTSVALPGNTSQLQEFYYQSNSVRDFTGLGVVPHLEVVDISDNELQIVHPDLFRKAKLLKLVNFSRNSISSLNHDAFLPKSALVIDLSYNKLKRIKFSNWVATEILLLHHNTLEEVDAYTFHGMSGLKELDLSHNSISQLQENLFQFLISLRKLDLSYNQVGAFESHLFRNAEVLEVLNLSHNNISKLNASTVLPISTLKYLALNDNHLRVVIPRMFRDMDRLQHLDLANNPFHCGCEMLAFRDWIARTSTPIHGLHATNSTAYTCKTPPERAGAHVSSWDVDKLECDESLLYLIIFGSFGLFMIVAGIAGTAVYRVYRTVQERKRKIQMLKWEIEWARMGAGKHGDKLGLASAEFAEEIREAIERKLRKEEAEKGERAKKGKPNSYVDLPRSGLEGGKRREEGGDKRREGRVYQEPDERQGNYDRLRRDMAADPSRRIHRERDAERRIMERGQRDSYDIQADYRARGGMRRESDWSVASQRPEVWYRPLSPPPARQRLIQHGPYVMTQQQNPGAARWEPVEVWEGPRGYSLYPPKARYGPRDGYYHTMPAPGSARRDSNRGNAATVTAMKHSSRNASEHPIDRNQARSATASPTQEVRFLEDGVIGGGGGGAKRYYRQRSSVDSVGGRARSHSYQTLSREYPEERVHGPDRLQREYERIDRDQPVSSQRAMSQPFLAHEATSDWL